MNNESVFPKRIILSKKGFDTSYGGYPSIIDGGNLISMPIPDIRNENQYTYSQLGKNFFKTVERYYRKIYEKGKKIEPFVEETKCHPDPNITKYFNTDKNKFLGSVGQEGKPQGHLKNKNITIGDIFLFFGLFAKWENGKVEDRKKWKHILFGYLQIGDMIYPQQRDKDKKEELKEKYPWLCSQPHWTNKYEKNSNNCIYVAAKNFCDTNLSGWGTFKCNEKLILTSTDADSFRKWGGLDDLEGLAISWNPNKTVKKSKIEVTRGFGQEFVIEENEKAIQWAKNLIIKNA